MKCFWNKILRTTVTKNDIKELKEAIVTLSKETKEAILTLSKQINALRLELKDVEKNLSIKINEVAADVKETKGKFEQLDKRVANQEFIYRAVFISIISVVASLVIKFFWEHPLV